MFNLSFYNFLYLYRCEKFSDSNPDFSSNVSYIMFKCDSDSPCSEYTDSGEKYGTCNVTNKNG